MTTFICPDPGMGRRKTLRMEKQLHILAETVTTNGITILILNIRMAIHNYSVFKLHFLQKSNSLKS